MLIKEIVKRNNTVLRTDVIDGKQLTVHVVSKEEFKQLRKAPKDSCDRSLRCAKVDEVYGYMYYDNGTTLVYFTKKA